MEISRVPVLDQPPSSKSFANFFPYIFAAILVAIVGGVLSPPGLKLFDLPEFYAPGRLLLNGNSSLIYNHDFIKAFEKSLFPGYQDPLLLVPPFSLALLVPLGLLPTNFANIVWFALIVLCSTAGLGTAARTCQMHPKVFLRLSMFLCAFGPEFEVVRHGQLATFSMLSIALCVLLAKQKRDFVAGICLISLLAKPQELLPLVVFALGARRIRLLMGLMLASTIVVFSSFLLFGTSVIASYIHLVSTTDRPEMASWLGPTVHGQLLRLFPTSSLADIISLLILAAALIFLFALGNRVKQRNDWWLYMPLAAVPVGLLTAMHCHNYGLVLLIPGITIFFGAPAFKQIPAKRKIIYLLPLALYVMPLYAKIHYEYVLPGAPLNPLFFALLYVATAASIWSWKTSLGNGSDTTITKNSVKATKGNVDAVSQYQTTSSECEPMSL